MGPLRKYPKILSLTLGVRLVLLGVGGICLWVDEPLK